MTSKLVIQIVMLLAASWRRQACGGLTWARRILQTGATTQIKPQTTVSSIGVNIVRVDSETLRLLGGFHADP